MKYTSVLIIFLLFTFQAFSQEPIRYLEDKSSYYISVLNANAVGKYRNHLKSYEIVPSNWGFTVGYLKNPYGSARASAVFYGAEFGFQGDGSDVITSQAFGDFRARFNNVTLNAVARYRPILGSTRLNPYGDAFFGAKFINTSVYEVLSDDQTQSLAGYRKIVPNYGIGIGTGIKLTGELSNKYLDIGIYYQQADATRIVSRKTVSISPNLEVAYKTILMPTNQLLVKVGITGFLSK